MNIEFIKWMVEKAGWKWIPPFENEVVSMISPSIQIDQYNMLIFITDDFEKSVWFHILLQRAIEGVEKNTKLEILAYWNKSGQCYESQVFTSDSEDAFPIHQVEYTDFTNIDQAKEAALKYIYEQEKV